ncbi:hypothetical protein [Gemmatimonas sp.]|uniref:hypothetical protein n=1 Tax=Gemmatimonas sp. TaxID=1962908 RepID=UPI003F72E99E
MPPLRSEIPLGTFAAYSPRGTSDTSIRSRQVRDIVKGVRRPLFEQFLDEMQAAPYREALAHVLGPDVIVVPVPRSAPLVNGGLWPGREIAEGLVSRGLAAEMRPMLSRVHAVPKSAFAKYGERPVPQTHYNSLDCEPSMISGTRITVIDDIVTKGATMLACAWRISDVLPGATIAAFSLIRTMGLRPDVEAIIDPHGGTINGAAYWSDRRDGNE